MTSSSYYSYIFFFILKKTLSIGFFFVCFLPINLCFTFEGWTSLNQEVDDSVCSCFHHLCLFIKLYINNLLILRGWTCKQSRLFLLTIILFKKKKTTIKCILTNSNRRRLRWRKLNTETTTNVMKKQNKSMNIFWLYSQRVFFFSSLKKCFSRFCSGWSSISAVIRLSSRWRLWLEGTGEGRGGRGRRGRWGRRNELCIWSRWERVGNLSFTSSCV